VYSQQRPQIVAMAPGAIPVNNATSATDEFRGSIRRDHHVNLSNKITQTFVRWHANTTIEFDE
jgi:hypothetical protein